jgi:3-hydroxyisobutyrate dehydrogenase-like beta-hydroxyacid dehydrogenase
MASASEPAIIGLLHPGEMGAAVGRCLTDRGHTVLWASAGRGPATAERASAAGLTDAGTAASVAARADIVISVCPPHAALDVARSLPALRGPYLDANAVAPATAREVARVVRGNGGRYVDGGIIGPPPEQPGSTRLYLSGSDSGATRKVADLFAGTRLEARIAGADECAASAVKMAYAAWTKGSAALLLAVRALAEERGVTADLLAEWRLSQPALADWSDGAQRSAARKGWRWEAEMREIAAAMAEAGQPDGFHLAAAEIFARYPRPVPGAGA